MKNILERKRKSVSLHPLNKKWFDSLAQQIEHNTFNVRGLGLSPKRTTRLKTILYLTINMV